jgi:protein-ribulosamine 3-kinase
VLFESEKSFFTEALTQSLNQNLPVKKVEHVGGGDINHAVKVTTSAETFFIKWNQFPQSDIFEKEARGLDLLGNSGSIEVAKPLAFGELKGKHFLILEHLDRGRQSRYFWKEFGRNLAKLHQTNGTHFGLDHNNYIGRLDQKNDFNHNWIDFFVNQRINPLVSAGREKGILSRSIVQKFDTLFTKLEQIIPEEKPALLHGDLWSGNFMCGPNGQAWLIDPAVYFGHREMELAFTQLFGGFDQRFYQSYQEAFPLIPGFDDRIEIHNLYPLLVHLNLFGSSYLQGIQHTLNRFV